jgi:hypothetical protein
VTAAITATVVVPIRFVSNLGTPATGGLAFAGASRSFTQDCSSVDVSTCNNKKQTANL